MSDSIEQKSLKEQFEIYKKIKAEREAKHSFCTLGAKNNSTALWSLIQREEASEETVLIYYVLDIMVASLEKIDERLYDIEVKINQNKKE